MKNSIIPWPKHISCRKGVCRNVWFLHGCLDVSYCYRSWDKTASSEPGKHLACGLMLPRPWWYTTLGNVQYLHGYGFLLYTWMHLRCFVQCSFTSTSHVAYVCKRSLNRFDHTKISVGIEVLMERKVFCMLYISSYFDTHVVWCHRQLHEVCLVELWAVAVGFHAALPQCRTVCVYHSALSHHPDLSWNDTECQPIPYHILSPKIPQAPCGRRKMAYHMLITWAFCTVLRCLLDTESHTISKENTSWIHFCSLMDKLHYDMWPNLTNMTFDGQKGYHKHQICTYPLSCWLISGWYISRANDDINCFNLLNQIRWICL